MATGDLANNVAKLKKALKAIDYPQEIDYIELTAGIPASFLPIFHYAFADYSYGIAALIADAGYELLGKTDLRFLETVYRFLRALFNYNPSITVGQFFSSGFAERKVILLTDVLKLCLKKERELQKEANSQAAARPIPVESANFAKPLAKSSQALRDVSNVEGKKESTTGKKTQTKASFPSQRLIGAPPSTSLPAVLYPKTAPLRTVKIVATEPDTVSLSHPATVPPSSSLPTSGSKVVSKSTFAIKAPSTQHQERDILAEARAVIQAVAQTEQTESHIVSHSPILAVSSPPSSVSSAVTSPSLSYTLPPPQQTPPSSPRETRSLPSHSQNMAVQTSPTATASSSSLTSQKEKESVLPTDVVTKVEDGLQTLVAKMSLLEGRLRLYEAKADAPSLVPASGPTQADRETETPNIHLEEFASVAQRFKEGKLLLQQHKQQRTNIWVS